MSATMQGTTIVCVRHGGKVVMAGDGQVSLGQMVMKATARKIRRVHEDLVLAGFAGSTADSFTLFGRFEDKLKEYSGNLTRAAVELAKDWRSDKILRRLEAMLMVADREKSFIISGSGEVIEPDGPVMAIGSGGGHALAAGRALVAHSDLSAREIAEEAMKITADICIYTNQNIILEEMEAAPKEDGAKTTG